MAFDAYFPHITLPKGKTDYRMGDGIAMICAGQVMLVDGFQGGQPTDGLKAWLDQNKIKDIDIAVLTHPHWDHYNGLLQIEEDSRFHIKLVYMYDPLTLKHGCDGSANGRSVKEDMDNAYKWIRAMQAHGTRVLWIDKGDTIKFGDINWKIFREQPTQFTEEDQGNGWAFVNNGSLCLYSPETELIFPGDGPDDQERMMDYFGGEVSGTDVTHHMGSWTQHNAKALKRRGCVVAFGSCVEKNGPGTSGWTQYGGRRIKEEGIPLWGQEADIYIHADNGTITFRQGDKTISKSIPYHREIKEGWVKNAAGWWYRNKDGSYPADCVIDLHWSKGISKFCFDEKGYMVTGWRKIDGTWYFFDRKNGDMKTGWIYDNGTWYYLGSDGKMVTGWVDYKGGRCYLDPASGHCYVSRTATIDGKTYQFDRDGYATEISAKSTLNGVDIASYQSRISPAQLSTTDFVIVKFTQGTSYLNPHADRQYSTSKSAGKLLGAYHYAEGKDAKAEAQHFVRSLGSRVGECVLALDWEGNQNSRFGSGQDVTWCKTFLDEVYRLTGVRALIYMSKSVCRKYDWSPVAQNYPLWCAQYRSNSTTDYQTSPWTDDKGFGAWQADTIRQYSSHGRIAGYDANIDIDLAYMSADQWRAMAGGKRREPQQGQREAIVSEAISHVGVKEGTVLHHKIIDRYNSRKPLPRGYAVKYTDAWCATFISYLAIVMGYTDIIPVECGCPQMIELAKQMGIWVEDDSYVPKPGDIVLYDWQDSGSGDNTGTADHIGLIEKVVGNTETVIEGNYQDSVKRRELAVNGRYIRGYIVPRYQ